MPRRVAKAGSADGRGVYGFMRDLILEGKVAKWVNNSGRYIVRDWSRALDCYADYKAKKNPLFKRTNQSRGKASNRLRAALLIAYKEDGAKEYMESKKVNEKNQVVERQFQMPSSVFESLFRNTELSDSGEEQDEQERKRLHLSEGAVEVQVSPESSSDAGFEETMDLSCEPSEPIHSASVGCFLNNPSLCDSSNFESEGPGTQFSDSDFETQMFDQVAVESALEEICSETERVSLLMGEVHEICPPSGSVKGQYPFNISLTEPLSDDITSGMAEFEGVEIVALKKMNPYTFSGFVPGN